MSSTKTNPVLQAFIEYVHDAWAQLLSGVLAGPCSVSVDQEATPGLGEAAVRLILKLEGALAGSAAVEMGQAEADTLAARLAQRSADGAQVPGQSVSVGGLLSQTVALAAKKLQSAYGRTLVTVGSGEACDWRPDKIVSFITNAPDCSPFSFRMVLSEGIITPTAASSRSSLQPAARSGMAGKTLQQANLDLILEVALDLKLQFGRRVLPLRDLVELAAGSVIELDRRLQEPADLLLGGNVIARGEVVLSEGHFALRVTEICDLQRRLESV